MIGGAGPLITEIYFVQEVLLRGKVNFKLGLGNLDETVSFRVLERSEQSPAVVFKFNCPAVKNPFVAEKKVVF